MYSFTNTSEKPIILISCECGRQYLNSELYCCTYCQNFYCRFCTTQEIHSFYCKNCNHTNFPTDIRFKNQCQTCFECPLCKNVLSVLFDNKKMHYFYCQFCYWNSKSIGLQELKFEELTMNCIQKVSDYADPKRQEYKKVVQNLKEQQILQEKNKKFMNILQKKLLSLSSKQEKQEKFTFDKLNQKLKKESEEIIKDAQILNTKDLQTYKLLTQNPDQLQDQQIQQIQSQQKHIIKPFRDFYKESHQNLDEELQAFINTKDIIITNSEECLKYPLIQPEHKAKCYPIPLQFLARKNRKCKDCKRILVRPESSHTNLLEYKIASYFYEYTPKILIKSIKKKSESEIFVILKVSNKTKNNLHLSIKSITSVKREDGSEDKFYESVFQNNELTQQFTLSSIDPLEMNKSQAESSQKKQKEQIEVLVKDVIEEQVRNNNQLKFGLNIECQNESDIDNLKLKFDCIIDLGNIFGPSQKQLEQKKSLTSSQSLSSSQTQQQQQQQI